jgi:hypothetical protein
VYLLNQSAFRSFPRKREPRGHLLRFFNLLPLGPRFRGDEREGSTSIHHALTTDLFKR